MSLISITATSVTTNWTAVPDASGYVVYVNDTAYSVIGSNNSTNITIDGLIPGTSYFITVRAYEDIVGPASTIQYFTSDNGRLNVLV